MSVVQIVSDSATIVEVVTPGPQGPAGFGFSTIIHSSVDYSQTLADDAFFGYATLTFTFLDPLVAVRPIDIRAVTGDILLDKINDDLQATEITQGISHRLYPTPTGWLYSG